MTKAPNERVVAVLTLHNVGKMSTRARASLALWLFKQAYALRFQGPNYADRFRARYIVKSRGAK